MRQSKKRLKTLFKTTAQRFPAEKHWVRMTQLGKIVFLSIYWLIPQDFSFENIGQLDEIREEVAAVIQQSYPDLMIDIIFTQDAKWAEDNYQ
jgi:predicted Co/Zn/Cd cation transporter (cation efflux family)